MEKEDFEKMGDTFVKNLKELGDGIKDLGKKVDDVQRKTVVIENKVEKIDVKEDILEDKNDIDPLSEPEKFSKSIEDKVTAKIEGKLVQDNWYKAECSKYDAIAFKKFPKLHDSASSFSKAVEVELKSIFPIGKDAKGQNILPPDAIFNAASRVAADLASKGQFEIIQTEELEPGGNFERKIKGKGISEIQKDLVTYYKGYGINDKRLEERIKARNAR